MAPCRKVFLLAYTPVCILLPSGQYHTCCAVFSSCWRLQRTHIYARNDSQPSDSVRFCQTGELCSCSAGLAVQEVCQHVLVPWCAAFKRGKTGQTVCRLQVGSFTYQELAYTLSLLQIYKLSERGLNAHRTHMCRTARGLLSGYLCE